MYMYPSSILDALLTTTQQIVSSEKGKYNEMTNCSSSAAGHLKGANWVMAGIAHAPSTEQFDVQNELTELSQSSVGHRSADSGSHRILTASHSSRTNIVIQPSRPLPIETLSLDPSAHPTTQMVFFDKISEHSLYRLDGLDPANRSLLYLSTVLADFFDVDPTLQTG